MPPELNLSGDFWDVLIVRELRGDFPDIPFFTDVDLAEITKGDTDPLYLTIPIAQANVVSGNKRFYDEAWLQELERQVIEKRPIGIMGHLSDAELGTKFPEEAIFWLGVKRIGEMLWAKGYLPARHEARERIRRYKAANKTIGTSIFAAAEGAWNAARGAYDMAAETMRLHQIDIGPADRIGIASLAMVPILTTEMQGENSEGETPMHEKTKLEYINELTADDARLLPKPVREAVLSEVAIPPEVAMVQELRSTLGVDDKADLATVVRELREAKEAQAKAAVSARVRELVEDKEKGIKVESIRGLVTELVNARNPQSVQEAESAYAAVIEMQSVKDTLAATVKTTMGPPQRTLVQPQNGGAQYFKYPDKKEA